MDERRALLDAVLLEYAAFTTTRIIPFHLEDYKQNRNKNVEIPTFVLYLATRENTSVSSKMIRKTRLKELEGIWR
jgi:hypothetical protein